jgi:hypothetical protein
LTFARERARQPVQRWPVAVNENVSALGLLCRLRRRSGPHRTPHLALRRFGVLRRSVCFLPESLPPSYLVAALESRNRRQCEVYPGTAGAPGNGANRVLV